MISADTLFAGHHQPLRVWSLCLYFMGLNLSNRQIARELGVDEDSAHEMATQLRQGPPEVVLSGEVECDEVCVVAGHQGHPEAVKKKETRLAAASERRSRSQHSGQRKAADLWDDSTHGRGRTADARQRPTGHARADLESHDQPRHDGLYRRVRHLQPTNRLGYQHRTVNHGLKEYARDEDGDGFHEVHVNTMEGCWSLLRSWLRPHRGISQEKMPLYVGFFQFVHNARKHGKALLESLVTTLLTKPLRNAG